MWRLFHYLFGWHYAEYRDTSNSFVFRIKRAPNGRVRLMSFWYEGYDAFLNLDGTFENTSGRWIALTWSGDLDLGK